MAYKKTNEAWFGDSFNRDSINCCYTAAIAPMQGELSLDGVTSSVTYANVNNYIDDGSLNCGGVVKAADFTISGTVDSFKDEIDKIRARLGNLEKGYNNTNRLRSALKTLSYTREVE